MNNILKFRVFEYNEMVYSESLKSNLMQYTGLKDKNGKEIYEGDILNGYSNFSSNHTDVSGNVVYFASGCYRILNNDRLVIDLNDCYNIEVIGNMYENPELLKEA